jgi:hypothetical protein
MKTCLHCNKELESETSTKKYCSNNCKQLAYLKRNGMVLAGMSSNVKYKAENSDIKNVKYNATKVNEKVVASEAIGNSIPIGETANVKHEAPYFTIEQMEIMQERI